MLLGSFLPLPTHHHFITFHTEKTGMNDIENFFFEWSPPSDILSDIYLTFYLAYILSFHSSGILAFDLTYCLTFHLAFYLTFHMAFYLIYIYIYIFWHSIRPSFWHSIWDLSDVLSGILSDIYSIWCYFSHSVWHLFWHSSGVCSGPGVPSCIQSSRWASGTCCDLRVRWCPQSQRACRGRRTRRRREEERRGRGEGGVAPLLKSRDPHLAVGEIYLCFPCPPIYPVHHQPLHPSNLVSDITLQTLTSHGQCRILDDCPIKHWYINHDWWYSRGIWPWCSMGPKHPWYSHEIHRNSHFARACPTRYIRRQGTAMPWLVLL